MATRSQELAKALLGDLFPLFAEAVDAGNRHFWRTYVDDAHKYTSICRAGMLRCLIADELKKRLAGRPGIAIDDRHQTTMFCIGHDWVVRVHKLDAGSRSATNETQRSLDLNDNDLQDVDLPGIPPSATVLTLGYVESLGDQLAPEIQLTCPDGDAPAWTIDLGSYLPPKAVEVKPPEPSKPSSGAEVVVRPTKRRKFSH